MYFSHGSPCCFFCPSTFLPPVETTTMIPGFPPGPTVAPIPASAEKGQRKAVAPGILPTIPRHCLSFASQSPAASPNIATTDDARALLASVVHREIKKYMESHYMPTATDASSSSAISLPSTSTMPPMRLLLLELLQLPPFPRLRTCRSTSNLPGGVQSSRSIPPRLLELRPWPPFSAIFNHP